MAKQNPNIHDAYVKETFSDKERAVAFFEAFLPPDVANLLNFDTLIVTKESYIDNALNPDYAID